MIAGSSWWGWGELQQITVVAVWNRTAVDLMQKEKSATKVYVKSVPQAKSSLFICLPYHGVLIIALLSDHLALVCFEFSFYVLWFLPSLQCHCSSVIQVFCITSWIWCVATKLLLCCSSRSLESGLVSLFFKCDFSYNLYSFLILKDAKMNRRDNKVVIVDTEHVCLFWSLSSITSRKILPLASYYFSRLILLNAVS